MKQSTQTTLIFCGILAVLLGAIAFAKRDTLFVPQMTIASRAFANGGDIPKIYTCDGNNVTPPLSFSGVPKTAYGIVLFVEDLDVPRGGYVHWVVYGIDPRVSLDEGKLPEGSMQGLNSAGKAAYAGFCPPPGKTHRYQFTAYAVSNNYRFVNPPDMKKLKSVMKWQVLTKATMTGKYTRPSI